MRTRKANCHPRKSKKNETCYEDADLIYLRDEWNRKHPSKPITSDQSKVIRKELDMYMQECSDEVCWTKLIQNEHKKKDILKKNFAVFQPKNWKNNQKEWLSNFDISNVLNQYKETYSDFDFIEPSPIDFDTKIGDKCVTNKICNLDLKDYLKRGIYKLAIPLNLDKHTGNGFHWVVLYVDLKRKFIYYFDSAKNKMPDEVKVLMDRLVTQTSIPLKKLDNQSKQHQQGDTECGMYVLFFIVSMLEGKSPKHFNQRTITDEEVFKCRSIYFNSED
jgi:hypothetical protein